MSFTQPETLAPTLGVMTSLGRGQVVVDIQAQPGMRSQPIFTPPPTLTHTLQVVGFSEQGKLAEGLGHGSVPVPR